MDILTHYDVAFVYDGFDIVNAQDLGDKLADYVDAGFGVVMAYFCINVNYHGIKGRILDYMAITPAFHKDGQSHLVPLDVFHPILKDVKSFDGGSSSYRSGLWDDDAQRIAAWSDGTPLIGARLINNARRVDLTFYPISSDIRDDFWQNNTDGIKIMVNSINWASGK